MKVHGDVSGWFGGDEWGTGLSGGVSVGVNEG